MNIGFSHVYFTTCLHPESFDSENTSLLYVMQLDFAPQPFWLSFCKRTSLFPLYLFLELWWFKCECSCVYLCTWAQITSLWCSLGRPMSDLAGWSKWLEAWRFQSPALPCAPFRFMLVVEAVTALLPVTGVMCAAPLSPPLCTQTSWNHKWK